MKLLVLSDSHHRRNDVSTIIFRNKDADAIIFLGDGLEDILEALEENGIDSSLAQNGTSIRSPQPAKDGSGTRRLQCKELVLLNGNCDSYSRCREHMIRDFGGVRFYMTHGVEENVKLGLWHLMESAAEHNCTVALYGHTHFAALDLKEGIYMFNPGAVVSGRYGVVLIENGQPKFINERL